MQGKQVEMILHTAILIAVSEDSKSVEPVVKLCGEVFHFSEAGVGLKLTECRGHKDQKFIPKQRDLFIPHHKIDHFYLAN